jgi:Xaa-Pro aminopeptidase
VRPSTELIAAHRKAQHAAKEVLRALAGQIGPDDTERSIAAKAAAALAERGVRQTWYYDSPALVLLGSRSCRSESGATYRPALEAVGQTYLVTIDLSPSYEGHWGDCARSFPIEEGRVALEPESHEFADGLLFLRNLHTAMREFVTPQTTFHSLASWAGQRIQAAGFVNLDFHGNVGHSIATRREDRTYIEAGNHRLLSEVRLFTFEPHVRADHGRWGFKQEDCFFFDSADRLEVL